MMSVHAMYSYNPPEMWHEYTSQKKSGGGLYGRTDIKYLRGLILKLHIYLYMYGVSMYVGAPFLYELIDPSHVYAL